ncbi:TonB-dependent receptor [Labilibaculum manganireducens]|uniref:SusC/RagA family TonB-linked outer membrane protein n=1 Tax=Labilibaculum manganireducens TaxID=1940525 RepID=UPI0029F58E44|nr:TonB-dependent receptor [Labilibaculum manganireducens]
MIKSINCCSKRNSRLLNIKIWFKPIVVVCLLMLQVLNVQAVSAKDSVGESKAETMQVEKKVSGKVIDDQGFPVPGASVVIKGTTIGTITDIDGNYAITSEIGSVLIFSFIGMETQEVVVGDQSLVNITLLTSSIGLEEVVAVGYGMQKKSTMTGAVEQVSSKALESRAVSNPVLALQGQTPGLTITRTSSRPGNEDINMQIRGATSVNGVSPLVVIDGVPAATGNAFFSMNPDDIETVTVLKDGMAAIYGSRAAGGVILVTTKRGKGKMKVDYTGNVRINTPGIKTPTANMQEYATLWLDANAQETSPLWWFAGKDEMLRMQQGIEGIYSTTHWGDIFIGQGDRYPELFQTRTSQQHSLSVSGSSDKTNYRFSVGYANNVGNLATAYDGQKQYNLKLNYDFKVSDRITLTSGVTYQKDHTSSPSGGIDWSMTSQDPPFFPAKNPYGQWHSNFGNAGNRNATALTTDGGRDDKYNSLTRIDLKVNVKLIKDLEFESSASIQENQFRREIYKLTVPLYTWDGDPAAGSLNSTSSISAETQNIYYQNYNSLLRYTKELGNHRISALAGVSAEKNEFKKLFASRSPITDNGVYDLNAADYTDKAGNSGGRNQWGLYSYYSRLNYSYNDTYLFEVLGRSDASSKFADGSRTANFFNVSGGWVLTNEDFVKDLNLSAIDFLKLKVSYGETGLQSGIGLYDYYSTIGLGTVVLGSTPATQPSAGISGNGLSMDPSTTWERVAMKNIGFEMRLLNNRLSADFNYYEKLNDGMLIRQTYPSILGGTAPYSNSGELEVKGWEAIVNWRDKIGDFTYNIGFNITDSRNKLVSYEGATTFNAGLNDRIIGRPLGSWMMYETDGFLQSQDEVDAYYAKYTGGLSGDADLTALKASDPTATLRPGDVKKVDLDGNGYISALGDPAKDKGDLKYMGDNAPHFVFGLNLGASWKGFDFNASFQGVGKQYIQRGDYLAYPFNAIWCNQNASFIGKTWAPENTNAYYPRLSTYTKRNEYNYKNNDFMLQNNRYIRLKSLIIGYTLPKEWLAKANIERARVFFSGNDLWESTSIKDGYDPEQGMGSNNAGYPFMRTWSLGVNLSF